MAYSNHGNNKRVKTYDAINDRTTIFVYDAGRLGSSMKLHHVVKRTGIGRRFLTRTVFGVGDKRNNPGLLF